ncbi:MAG TPA: VanZ family protein [Allosphingosinicella sp.]|jgi:VanZ family protein
MERLLRTAFWAAACFAFLMATLPRPPHLPGDPSDKVQHILAFAVLALLAALAYSRLSAWRVGLGLSLFGAAIELVQLIPPLHRDGDVVDWCADTVSAALILALARLLQRGFAGDSPRRPGEEQG